MFVIARLYARNGGHRFHPVRRGCIWYDKREISRRFALGGAKAGRVDADGKLLWRSSGSHVSSRCLGLASLPSMIE
ncbi:hypothetical protein RHSP_82748 [Rhizobium freirei PRF 81]|uniref:Uncharacterized protein n=1 Tax=Rhizobium freirei PRF 81 TaxID=363754 RepID=N6UVC1_9HYPH|nr:hypothetical protein RHSP_82748 [Rhizobium freirei PRF 81]